MQRLTGVSRVLCSAGCWFLASWDTVSAQTTSRDGNVVPIVFIGLLLVGAMLLGWLNYWENQPFRGSGESTLDQAGVLRHVIDVYTAEGWRVTSRDESTVTFSKRINPGCGLTFVLALFAVLPAIIYLLVGGKDLSASVHAIPGGRGMVQVEVVGNACGYGSRRVAARSLNSLP